MRCELDLGHRSVGALDRDFIQEPNIYVRV